MKIELPIRWTNLKQDKEALEERRNRRIINGDDEDDEVSDKDSKLIEYTYDVIVIDSEDIKSFHRLDRQHTVVKFYDSDSGYVIRIDYESFREIYQDLTGKAIKIVQMMEVPDDEIENENDKDDDFGIRSVNLDL